MMCASDRGVAPGAALRRVGLGMAMLAVLAGCGDGAATGPEPRYPATLQVAGGNAQDGVVAQALPQPIAVRVVDDQGDPLAGQPVTFTVISGAGTLSAATDSSDATGVASVGWTLGTSSTASQVVDASVTREGAAPLVARFTATARPGPAVRLVATASPTGGVVDTPMADSLAVRAEDAYGNGVSGVTVAWEAVQGGGGVSPAASVTGADGIARSQWTLGSRSDLVYSANAVSPGLPGVGFSAFAASAMDPLEGHGLTVPAGSVVNVGVVLGGQAGGVANVPVQWTVASGGGYVSAPTTRTTSGTFAGIARVQWTLGPNGGVQTLRASSGTVQTLITVDATPLGSRVLLAHLPGPALDALGPRLLWLDVEGGDRVVKIRSAWNGGDVVVKADPSSGPDHQLHGHLTPAGALVWNRDRIFDFRDDVLHDLGEVSGPVSTTDDWAAWSSGSAVLRLDLSSGALATVSSSGAASVRVGANGDVVYLQAGRAWRYRNGTTAQVSVESADPLLSVDTDGINVVYLTRPAGGAATLRLDLPGGDRAYPGQAGASDGWASVGLNSGWTVFSVPPIPATRRSPSGVEHRMTASTAGLRIEAVSPVGAVIYVNPATGSYVLLDRWGLAFPMGPVAGSHIRWRVDRFQQVVGQDVFVLIQP